MNIACLSMDVSHSEYQFVELASVIFTLELSYAFRNLNSHIRGGTRGILVSCERPLTFSVTYDKPFTLPITYGQLIHSDKNF